MLSNMKSLVLLAAVVCPLGALAADCEMTHKDSILGTLSGHKKEKAGSFNYKKGKVVKDHGEICEPRDDTMWTMAMVIDQDVEDDGYGHESLSEKFSFVLMDKDCKIKGIYEPPEDSDKCDDVVISDPKVLHKDPKNPKTHLMMMIHRYGKEGGDESDLNGTFSFTYGAYHGETSYNDPAIDHYPSCGMSESNLGPDHDQFYIAACGHRFRWDGDEHDRRRAVEFKA